MRGKVAQEFLDSMIAGLAGRQHGVVSRGQLLAIGLSADQIDRRVRAGRLHPLYRGVYAVGHRVLSRKGHWMAAVLACGDGAVLSHRDAATLWGIRASAASRIDVTVPSRGGRAGRSRLRLHRVRLPAEETTIRDGIPVTTLPRTLLDLAAVVPGDALKKATKEAERLRLFDLAEVNRTLHGNTRRPGCRALRTALATYEEPAFTRSDLEGLMLALCERHRLPKPLVNTTVAGYEVDFLWSEPGLIVETDGRQDHLTRHAFEEDRARDVRLTVLGYRVLRFTHRQLVYESARVALSISSTLYPSGSRTNAIRGPSVRPPGR